MAWNPFKKGKQESDTPYPPENVPPPSKKPSGGSFGGYAPTSGGYFGVSEQAGDGRLNTSPIRLARRIGDIFFATGRITEADLEEAFALSGSEGILLGRALITMGKFREGEVLHCLDQQKLITSVDIGRLRIPPEVLSRVPDSLIRTNHFVPFDVINDLLCICSKSVLSFDSVKSIRDRTRMRVRTFDSLKGWNALKDCIEIYYPSA